MSIDFSLHQAPLLAVLEERNPAMLPERRRWARRALQHLPARLLERTLSPALAGVLLDAVRLGGIELDAGGLGLAEAEVAQLAETRGVLSRLAHRSTDVSSVGCLLPGDGRWQPMSMTWAESPYPRSRPLAVLLDHGRQRADDVAEALQEIAEAHAGAVSDIFIGRTRFGHEVRCIPDTWNFGIATAVVASRRKGRHVIPRWAAFSTHRAPSLALLPPDVRLLLLCGGSAVPFGDHAVFGPKDIDAARTRFARGQTVCFTVSSVEEGVACVLPFEQVL